MNDDYDDLPFSAGDAPGFVVETPRKCFHRWVNYHNDGRDWTACNRCGTVKDPATATRNRNNGRRGRSDELTVARMLGGRKVGQLNLPWDVEIPGYARIQCKRLDRWPSIGKVVEWLDAIPVGEEMRGVTLADTPGPGGRTRRLIVFDLSEFAERHGRA